MREPDSSYLKFAMVLALLLVSGLAIATERIGLPKEIVLATHNLPPYGSFQADGTFKGIAADRVECALKLMDVKLVLNVRPWNRAQFEVKRGIADGFFAGSKNDERERYAVRSIEVADQKWQWYLLKESPWDVTSSAFHSSAKVSSFLGANMQKWLIDNNYNITSKPTDTKGLAEMLLRERLDAALANNYVMDQVLEEMGAGSSVQRYVLKSKPLYVYFGKGFIAENPKFLNLFNSFMSKCIDSIGGSKH